MLHSPRKFDHIYSHPQDPEATITDATKQNVVYFILPIQRGGGTQLCKHWGYGKSTSMR